jgi:hypothetical protein
MTAPGRARGALPQQRTTALRPFRQAGQRSAMWREAAGGTRHQRPVPDIGIPTGAHRITPGRMTPLGPGTRCCQRAHDPDRPCPEQRKASHTGSQSGIGRPRHGWSRLTRRPGMLGPEADGGDHALHPRRGRHRPGGWPAGSSAIVAAARPRPRPVEAGKHRPSVNLSRSRTRQVHAMCMRCA